MPNYIEEAQIRPTSTLYDMASSTGKTIIMDNSLNTLPPQQNYFGKHTQKTYNTSPEADARQHDHLLSVTTETTVDPELSPRTTRRAHKKSLSKWISVLRLQDKSLTLKDNPDDELIIKRYGKHTKISHHSMRAINICTS